MIPCVLSITIFHLLFLLFANVLSAILQLTGYDIPELIELTRPMLQPTFEARPNARAVLEAFDRMASRIPEARLRMVLVH